eukprot:Selendium_serpulae@DN4822_c0_g2_i3.p1
MSHRLIALSFLLYAVVCNSERTVRGREEDEREFPEERRVLIDSQFAFPTVVSTYLPAPFITAGACNAGTKYKIQKVADLYNYLDQIECVFSAGLTPTQIGLGYGYGTLLLAANTAWPATVSETVYQGDYIVKTWCSGAYHNIGILNIAGLDVGTATWTVGELPGHVAPGEYWDGKPSVIADFRVDVNQLCPVEGNESKIGLQGFVPFRNSIPPINGYLDVARVVGRDSRDGGLIYLCKAFSTSEKEGLSTVLYYALKNFDPRVDVIDDYGVQRTFAPTYEGEEIFVAKDFTYSRKGVRAAIEGLPASLDVLKMQHMVAERDALDAILSNSVFGYPIPDVGYDGPGGLAGVFAGAAESFGGGIVSGISEHLLAAAGGGNFQSVADRLVDAGGGALGRIPGVGYAESMFNQGDERRRR